jgi:hypothetical protein
MDDTFKKPEWQPMKFANLVRKHTKALEQTQRKTKQQLRNTMGQSFSQVKHGPYVYHL